MPEFAQPYSWSGGLFAVFLSFDLSQARAVRKRLDVFFHKRPIGLAVLTDWQLDAQSVDTRRSHFAAVVEPIFFFFDDDGQENRGEFCHREFWLQYPDVDRCRRKAFCLIERLAY